MVDTVPGLDGEEGISWLAPIVVEATVTNTGSSFLVQGRLQTELMVQCSRCLKEFSWSLSASLDEEYLPAGGEPAQAASRELPQFAERSFFSGDTIDLSEAVREQALLGLPYQILCREDCPGLCPVCGHQLAQGACGCRSESLDPRMAGLAQLLGDRPRGDAES